jgi:hypothetical protein
MNTANTVIMLVDIMLDIVHIKAVTAIITPHHHHKRHHKHKIAPDTSLAAYTMHHNALPVPLSAAVAAVTTQTQAPQWHATGVVTRDPVKEFNESMFSALLDKSTTANPGNLHVNIPNQSMATSGTLFHPQSAHHKSTSLVGKMRMDPTRSVVKSNRPMSSPGGYALYMK